MSRHFKYTRHKVASSRTSLLSHAGDQEWVEMTPASYWPGLTTNSQTIIDGGLSSAIPSLIRARFGPIGDTSRAAPDTSPNLVVELGLDSDGNLYESSSEARDRMGESISTRGSYRRYGSPTP